MSEFIREVDEEYRHDLFRKFLVRYWGAILAIVLLILAAVGAWRGYAAWRQGQAEAAGSRYFDALQLSRDDPAASLNALDALTRDAPAGYQVLARLRAAADTGRTDPVKGASAFDAIAADPSFDADLREVARLRAAILMVDSAPPDELRRRLEPLADANAPYRNIARELLALAALKAGDDETAGRWLDPIVADPSAAPDIRQRAGLYLGLVRAGKAAPKP